MNKTINTIFFDIGGVLIDINFKRTAQFLADCTDLTVEEIESSFPIKDHDNYEKGILSDQDFFLAVKESLPQPCCLKESDFWKAWRLLLGEETEVVKILKKLKKNYSIWLLSNTNPKHINDEIEKNYSFPKLVDGAIYSFNIGHRKPENEIYIKAAQMAKSDPKECLFIDDLYENVESANNIGFSSIHFKSFKDLLFKLDKKSIVL